MYESFRITSLVLCGTLVWKCWLHRCEPHAFFLMKVLLALVLLAFTAFCSLGFLATYEPVDGALAWRAGYGIAIIVSLYGVFLA